MIKHEPTKTSKPPSSTVSCPFGKHIGPVCLYHLSSFVIMKPLANSAASFKPLFFHQPTNWTRTSMGWAILLQPFTNHSPIKAIWDWFPLTIYCEVVGWGRYNLPRLWIYPDNSPSIIMKRVKMARFKPLFFISQPMDGKRTSMVGRSSLKITSVNIN